MDREDNVKFYPAPSGEDGEMIMSFSLPFKKFKRYANNKQRGVGFTNRFFVFLCAMGTSEQIIAFDHKDVDVPTLEDKCGFYPFSIVCSKNSNKGAIAAFLSKCPGLTTRFLHGSPKPFPGLLADHNLEGIQACVDYNNRQIHWYNIIDLNRGPDLYKNSFTYCRDNGLLNAIKILLRCAYFSVNEIDMPPRIRSIFDTANSLLRVRYETTTNGIIKEIVKIGRKDIKFNPALPIACSDERMDQDTILEMISHPYTELNSEQDGFTSFYLACYTGKTKVVNAFLDETTRKVDYNKGSPIWTLLGNDEYMPLIERMGRDYRISLKPKTPLTRSSLIFCAEMFLELACTGRLELSNFYPTTWRGFYVPIGEEKLINWKTYACNPLPKTEPLDSSPEEYKNMTLKQIREINNLPNVLVINIFCLVVLVTDGYYNIRERSEEWKWLYSVNNIASIPAIHKAEKMHITISRFFRMMIKLPYELQVKCCWSVCGEANTIMPTKYLNDFFKSILLSSEYGYFP